MLVSTMIDKIIRMTNLPATDILGDKRAVIMDYISGVQQEWAERTGRFTKKAYTTTRASGGERAQGEYNLVRQPGATTGGLPYGLIAVRGVTWNNQMLEPAVWASEKIRKEIHDGAYYDDPKFYWVENNVLHLWPIPKTAKTLWVIYSAKPNDIESESEYIVIPETTTLFYGVCSLLYAQLKDTENHFAFKQLYEKRIREQTQPVVSQGAIAPYADIDNPNAALGSELGTFFGV